jgi:hypothetical protein
MQNGLGLDLDWSRLVGGFQNSPDPDLEPKMDFQIAARSRFWRAPPTPPSRLDLFGQISRLQKKREFYVFLLLMLMII